MAARKNLSNDQLAAKAIAEAGGSSKKKSPKKKASKKGASKKASKKTRKTSGETGKLRDAVRVINEARRLVADAGCSLGSGHARSAPRKKR